MSDDINEMAINSLRRMLQTSLPLSKMNDREVGDWDADVWRQMGELGMTSIATDYGGDGVELIGDTLVEVGRAMAVVPSVEHDLLGTWVLMQGGASAPSDELLTVVVAADDGELSARRKADGWRLDGRASRVPFARHADAVVVALVVDGRNLALSVPRAELGIIEASNLAGEPRDTLIFQEIDVDTANVVALPEEITPERILARGALGRCFLMLGAMETAFTMTHEYAYARKQFGRSLSQFQVLQSHMAEAVGEIAASVAICRVAAQADRIEEIAAARIRVGQAARIVAEQAHQIHGAMGFTQEYPLHFATRRLWSWREEFGNETYWADRLSRSITQIGADGLWSRMTG